MSIPGLACDAGGGFQQLPSLANTSLRVLTCAGWACAIKLDEANSIAPASHVSGWRCQATAAHLTSDATCTFTILSGSATGSPRLSLSTTSMPDTTSPSTADWPFSDKPPGNRTRNV